MATTVVCQVCGAPQPHDGRVCRYCGATYKPLSEFEKAQRRCWRCWSPTSPDAIKIDEYPFCNPCIFLLKKMTSKEKRQDARMRYDNIRLGLMPLGGRRD